MTLLAGNLNYTFLLFYKIIFIYFVFQDLEEFCFRFTLNHLTAVTQTESFGKLNGETVRDFVIKAGANGAFKR